MINCSLILYGSFQADLKSNTISVKEEYGVFFINSKDWLDFIGQVVELVSKSLLGHSSKNIAGYNKVKNFERLLEVFNNGSADSEKDFLVDAFVPSEDFDDIISFPSKTCRLLIGNKGSGKSALLEYIDLNCHKNNIYSLYLTPDEVLEENFDEL